MKNNKFPRFARELADQDYAHKLSPEDRKWLAKFNKAYYSNLYDADNTWTPEERRVNARRNHAARRDTYALGKRTYTHKPDK